MPATTTPDSTATGASNMPTASPRITCRRTARSSTPSNGYGNSHADCAYTTATSRPSTKSSALSRVNLRTGVGATPPCADYAQLFKTLCIVYFQPLPDTSRSYCRFILSALSRNRLCAIVVASDRPTGQRRSVMKHAIYKVMILAALLAIPAAALYAQSTSARFTVPFQFVVNGHTLPAGDYVVEGLWWNAVAFHHGKGDANLIVMAQYSPRNQEAQTKLIFHRYGSHYVLATAELPNTNYGRAFNAGKV